MIDRNGDRSDGCRRRMGRTNNSMTVCIATIV